MSDWPRNAALQQYLFNPRSSKTLADSSPASVLFLYVSHNCAIGLPHEKHLIGIIMNISEKVRLKKF